MSDKTKHTPGPWRTKREGFSTVYVEARIDGGLIQEVAACGPTEAGLEQQEANARLIAAAPELLDALIALLGVAPSKAPGAGLIVGAEEKHANALQAARAAIKKATGDA